jgi:hypothetical protein
MITQTKFAYRNKTNGKWLKIGVDQYSRKEYLLVSPCREGEYELLTDASMYCSRNIIEEDFCHLSIDNKADYELVKIEVSYNIKQND